MASARQRAQAGARFCYERHRPEETTLYRVVQEELEIFLDRGKKRIELFGYRPPRWVVRVMRSS